MPSLRKVKKQLSFLSFQIFLPSKLLLVFLVKVLEFLRQRCYFLLAKNLIFCGCLGLPHWFLLSFIDRFDDRLTGHFDVVFDRTHFMQSILGHSED